MTTDVVATPLSPLQELVKDYPADLVQKVKDIVEKDNQVRMDELAKTVREENQKSIDAALDDIKSKMKPPSQEDIQKLLDQELLTFTIKLPAKNGTDVRTFTIRELPQKIEKKILRIAKDRLVPIATDISALTMNLLEGDAATKIVNLMNTFEPAIQVVSEICAVVLNPYDEDKDITPEWIQDNLTTQKITTIVMAQFECNRLRDFFLLLSRGIN